MSGIDIRHGGALEVDTDALRSLALRLRAVAAGIDAARAALRPAQRVLLWPAGFAFDALPSGLEPMCRRLDGLRETVDDTVGSIDGMADAYELVELRVRSGALDVDGGAPAIDLRFRIAALAARNPEAATMADTLIAEWEKNRFAGFHEQAVVAGAVLPVIPLVTRMWSAGAESFDRGVIPAGTVLQGTPTPVSLEAVATSRPRSAPTSLAASLGRFPQSPGAQVRVEKYTMPDGRRRFAVYVMGTQTAFGREPWDMISNGQLYAHASSSSYQATLDALAAAGAEPGDAVHAWGHSQGGMIVAHLAMEGPYEVRTVVTAGSPVEPTLGDDVLSVQLRHTDEPISVLAAGGSPGGTGSPDSFVAQRVADPMPRLQDLWLQAHRLDAYAETAALVDASGDVRVRALEEVWTELATATSIEATEFRAERVE